MRLTRLAVLLLTLVMAQKVVAAQVPDTAILPAGIERVTAVEGITEYQLDNGLRVLLFPDASQSTITVNMTYLVGSAREDYGETGMAHLLEHMLFKGSEGHPNIPKELQDHGSRPNGTTSYERTNYFETFEATDENLEWALDLEADRMLHAFVAQKDLDSEMTVVRNEFESGENDPLGILYERVLSTAYLWHNYGKSVIGSRSDIENVPIDRLQAFYHRYYQPDNAILVVAGKIDEAQTLDRINRLYGPIPRPDRELPKIYTQEPTQDGEREVVLRRVGDVQYVMVAYHTPPASHADSAALSIASLILTDAPSGRLYQALVDSGEASSVSRSLMRERDAGMTLFYAQVREDSSLDDARETLIATIDDIASDPLTSEEVERARNRILTDIDLQLNDTSRVALNLSNWASMGDWRLLFLDRDRVRDMSAEEVQRVAVKYFKRDNRTVGMFIPSDEPLRSEVPEAPDFAALFENYSGADAPSAGEDFDASPENIEARTQRTTLPGGTTLVLLPKETRGDSVRAVLRLPFGDADSLRGQSAVASLTGAMLMRGSTEHTRQDIRDELDRLHARVNVFGNATGAQASIQTTRENLPAALELAIEILRRPAFPASEFESLLQQRLAGLESQKADPDAVVSIAFERHLNPFPPGDVRYVPTIDEEMADLGSVSIDDMRRFHEGFYGASNAELSIVGDFDPDAVEQVVAADLDGWASPKPYVEVTKPYQEVDPLEQDFETPDKANAFFMAGLLLNVGDEHPDYPALLFGNYILGQGINSRLFARIRGQEGLSYGVGSSLSASSLEESGRFSAYAISAPENAAQVEASFKDELSIIIRDGFSDDEITAAKASWLQSRQVSRAQDATLANQLLDLTHLGRTMAWEEELEAKVQALTRDDIRSAFARHIDLSRMTFMKGGDFAAGRTEDRSPN